MTDANKNHNRNPLSRRTFRCHERSLLCVRGGCDVPHGKIVAASLRHYHTYLVWRRLAIWCAPENFGAKKDYRQKHGESVSSWQGQWLAQESTIFNQKLVLVINFTFGQDLSSHPWSSHEPCRFFICTKALKLVHCYPDNSGAR